MFMDVLRAIAGIGTFPAIALVLFVATFVAVVVRALRMDRRAADRLARMPLDEAGDAGRTGAPSSFEGASRGA